MLPHRNLIPSLAAAIPEMDKLMLEEPIEAGSMPYRRATNKNISVSDDVGEIWIIKFKKYKNLIFFSHSTTCIGPLPHRNIAVIPLNGRLWLMTNESRFSVRSARKKHSRRHFVTLLSAQAPARTAKLAGLLTARTSWGCRRSHVARRIQSTRRSCATSFPTLDSVPMDHDASLFISWRRLEHLRLQEFS